MVETEPLKSPEKVADKSGMTPELRSVSPALITGTAAALGASIGAVTGYLVAMLIAQPAESSTSLSGWIIENGSAFASLLIPLFITGALIGWLALPAIAGRVLGWPNVALAASYQMGLGAIGLPAAIWAAGSLDGLTGQTYVWVAGVLFVGVAAGIPIMSRTLATRHESTRSTPSGKLVQT
jgi:hypothetical protein